MPTPEQVKQSLVAAFANSQYPGDWCLVESFEGHEPALLVAEFRGKTDWRTLDADFLDQAPDGFGSALSFFSDEAFRFYLPAFLIACIDGKLMHADPVFSLTHGLDDRSKAQLVNPLRYGDRTWFEERRHKFSMFTTEQAAAIVAFLELMAERDSLDGSTIRQSIGNYWAARAGRD